MSSPARFSRKVCFGEFELHLESAELWKNGNKAILPGQPFQILITLLDRPGQLVTRQELKKRLWPSNTFVDFNQSLNKAVNRLREALGDSAEHPQFIETLPRKGYRFIGTVQAGPLEIGAADRTDKTVLIHQLYSSENGAGNNASGQRIVSDRDQSTLAASYQRSFMPAALIGILVVAILVFAISKWRSHSEWPDLANVLITKITNTGQAREVAISPDGRYLVYALSHGEEESLRLREIATSRDVQTLGSGPGFHGLTFSPDGNYVYFIRSDPNDPYLKYLYSMSALGGPVRKIIVDVDSPVSFSPDGRQFAFERAVTARNVIELRLSNADGSGDHVLATIQNGDAGLFQPGPNWSRDGRTIVAPYRIGILGRQRRWVLASASVPGGKVQEIYSSPVPLGRPVWLSSGDRLLIPHYDMAYERAQLWTISYPGGVARRFTNDLADYDQPLDITRDGRTVAAIGSTVISNIWVAPAEDSLKARQITFGSLPMMDIAEAIDGKLLSTSADGRLWRMNADGGEREPVADAHNVGWVRRCGRFVLFASYQADTVTLTRVDPAGSHPTNLFSGDLHYPGCSPDGKFAVYTNLHRPQIIWRIPIEGGPPVEIAPAFGEGVTGLLDVSPDAALVAYPFDEYSPPSWKIAVISATDGTPVKTLKVPGGITRMRWSPSGTGLQYLMTQNAATNIWEQSLAGGEPKQLTKFTSSRIVDFTWSSDHQRLLLTRGDVTSDVVLFNNFR